MLDDGRFAEESGSGDVIRIGLLTPLTGLVEIYGEEIALAGKIACQQVNDEGGHATITNGVTIELGQGEVAFFSETVGTRGAAPLVFQTRDPYTGQGLSPLDIREPALGGGPEVEPQDCQM